jgi:hypothetical protein
MDNKEKRTVRSLLLGDDNVVFVRVGQAGRTL